MKYIFKEKTIRELVDLIEKDKVDLNPSYQRNFIWTPKDQCDLVDTIIKGYPLPNFFIYLKPDGKYEMVDGQQRSKTIYRFIKGQITSSKEFDKKRFMDLEMESILNYRLPFVVISDIADSKSLKDFYVLINKKGKFLNVPEVYKSEFHDTLFMRLSTEMADYQPFIELDLFTEASANRMNDRAFVEELLVYLKLGIRDKKKDVETTYSNDINDDEYRFLKARFLSIIDVLSEFNTFKPIKVTRFKQKNDFYTLFSFIHDNLSLNQETLLIQYKILLILDERDMEGRQFIRPTNQECEVLKSYAYNCVTQSNSKSAREARISIFDSILKNKNETPNEVLTDVLNYLSKWFEEDSIELRKIEDFYLLDTNRLNRKNNA